MTNTYVCLCNLVRNSQNSKNAGLTVTALAITLFSPLQLLVWGSETFSATSRVITITLPSWPLYISFINNWIQYSWYSLHQTEDRNTFDCSRSLSKKFQFTTLWIYCFFKVWVHFIYSLFLFHVKTVIFSIQFEINYYIFCFKRKQNIDNLTVI